ncbi:transferase, partial [Enterococcus faecium]
AGNLAKVIMSLDEYYKKINNMKNP